MQSILRRHTPLATLFVVLGILLACDRGTTFKDRELTVACGLCILKADGRGCYWAAEVDGKVLPVVGPGVPEDHNAHGPGGMCTMRRAAVVDGTLHEERIIADRFELKPAEDLVDAPAHDHKH